MNSQKIPEHIMAAANALLAPYGVNLADLMRKAGGISGPKYMTAQQASVYCGLSAKTIRDKALSKQIRSVRIGHSDKSRVLIDRADLDRWLESFNTDAANQ